MNNRSISKQQNYFTIQNLNEMRNLILAAAITFMTGYASAQKQIGVHIGTSTNFIDFDGLSNIITDKISGHTDLSAGIDLRLPMDQNFNFRTGVNYRQKGFNSNIGTSFDIGGLPIPIGAKAQVRVNYIDIPANLEYKIVNKENLKVYAFAGPYAAYSLKGHIQTRANLLFDINVKRFDLDLNNTNQSRVELGANAGGGISTTIGSGNLFAEVNYQHGFTNQMSTDLIALNGKNRTINTAIGYRFAF